MKMIVRLSLKIINKLFIIIYNYFCYIITRTRLFYNRVEFGYDFKSNGAPTINVHKTGKLKFGNHVTLNNGRYFNQIGRQQPCYFIVGPDSILQIGNNVGISDSAFVCYNTMIIEDFVKIGGNTVVYDTNFHSINPHDRLQPNEDRSKVKKKPVLIKTNAFIGAHSIILKGVTIGRNSIIGAGSVVTKNVPDNEIWAGNPAKFVSKISTGDAC